MVLEENLSVCGLTIKPKPTARFAARAERVLMTVILLVLAQLLAAGTVTDAKNYSIFVVR